MNRNIAFSLIIVFVIAIASLLLLRSSSSSTQHQIQTPSTTSTPRSFVRTPISSSQNQDQTDHNNDANVDLLGPNLTYSQRYATCLSLKNNKSPEQLQHYFQQKFDLMTSSPKLKFNELVLLRIHKRPFTLDFWLHTCSMIVEIVKNNDDDDDSTSFPSVSRHIFLFTLIGHEEAVPAEFKPFIKAHDEDQLATRFGDHIYTGGYQRGGDLASADFLERVPENRERYDFVWSVEYDVRFAGRSWSDLFFNSRFVIGTMRKDLLEDGQENEVLGTDIDKPSQYRYQFQCHRDLVAMMSNQQKQVVKQSTISKMLNDEKNHPHLVFFYPPIYNDGYQNEGKKRLAEFNDQKQRRAGGSRNSFERLVPLRHMWHFSNDKYFRGNWKTVLTNRKWVGSLMPIFGMSKKLALAIVRDGLAGNSHVNQEVVLPVTAQLEKLKMISTFGCFPSQHYFSFHRRRETAPMYVEWASSYFLKEKQQGEGKENDVDVDVAEFKNGAREVPQIGFDIFMSKKKITRNAAAFYGVLTKDFVDRDEVGHVLFHPVKF